MSYAHGASATFVPGVDDGYYMPPHSPELVSPEPQRFQPDMSAQIADGIEAVQNLTLNATSQRGSSDQFNSQHSDRLKHSDQLNRDELPHFSPFPKLINPPPNVPLSDEELEATLENARTSVLSSTDPDIQLAWAADALVFVGVCADNEERIAAARPSSARSSTPRIEHQLKMDAMSIVNFLADQKHPKAEFLRGMWLEWGRFGQREDKKEAFRCYSRAADKGYTRAEYRIGQLYESYNDPAKALRHYNRGVDAGDAASCYRLGMMTLRGQCGQPQDYARGIDLIRRSAEAADENAAQGAYVYGMLLCRGLPQISVPEIYLTFDERKARMNIEKAAYLKFAKAQLKMGSAYELGSFGCDFNPALSMHYNALASKQGEAEADMALSKWFLVGSEGVFPKNEDLAYTYAERAAQGGLATGEFALGYFNEIGMHVPVDLDKAMEWYRKASSHGNEDAKGRIAGLENKQVLSKKDHEKIAISRIKSQYGSVRGSRPERFQEQQNQQPRNGYDNGMLGPNSVPPPRGTTPYPEDDGPMGAAHAGPRSSSVTPYPLEDGPPRDSTPRLGQGAFYGAQQPSPRPNANFSPELRPSSAFQINPALHQNVAGTGYGGHQPYTGAPPQDRSQSARPYPGQGTGQPSQSYRVPSGPPANQGYRPQQGPPPTMSSRPPTVPPQAPQSVGSPRPPVDIGFSAPVDDRRNRTYGPGGPGRPQVDTSGRMPPRQSSAGYSNSIPQAQRPPAQTTRPQDSRRPTDPRPPPKTGPSGPAAPPKTSAQAPSAAAKPAAAPKPAPQKGPKTFDEMGVPAQKQDGECILM